MKENRRLQELAKYAQGKQGEVEPHGTFGWLDGTMVNKSHGEVVHEGDRIQVIDNMIFRNGHYQGTTE